MKAEKQIIGKTINAVSNNKEFGVCQIQFTDGTLAMFKAYHAGDHREEIEILYRDDRTAIW